MTPYFICRACYTEVPATGPGYLYTPDPAVDSTFVYCPPCGASIPGSIRMEKFIEVCRQHDQRRWAARKVVECWTFVKFHAALLLIKIGALELRK